MRDCFMLQDIDGLAAEALVDGEMNLVLFFWCPGGLFLTNMGV